MRPKVPWNCDPVDNTKGKKMGGNKALKLTLIPCPNSEALGTHADQRVHMLLH